MMESRQRRTAAASTRKLLLLAGGVLCALRTHASKAFITTTRKPCYHSFAPSARTCRRVPTTNTLLFAKHAKKQESLSPPENEFSRTFRPDRLLKTSNKRGYSVTVTAEATEREALAARFDLSNIAKLKADVTVRPELIGSSSRGGAASGVEVEGTCWSTVTQRCVRTNEDFQVDLEFPIYSIVRPVMPATLFPDNNDENANDRARKTGPRGGMSSAYRATQDRNLDDMDVLELQRMLQYDISDDDVMEDESIFPEDGMLDIGELIAQLFWLKLDPYPKRPGTDPVQRSITG